METNDVIDRETVRQILESYLENMFLEDAAPPREALPVETTITDRYLLVDEAEICGHLTVEVQGERFTFTCISFVWESGFGWAQATEPNLTIETIEH